MSETNRLEPCPFCGSEAVIEETIPQGWFLARCNSDFPCVAMSENPDRQKAIEAWNRRPTIPGDGRWEKLAKFAYDLGNGPQHQMADRILAKMTELEALTQVPGPREERDNIKTKLTDDGRVKCPGCHSKCAVGGGEYIGFGNHHPNQYSCYVCGERFEIESQELPKADQGEQK